MAPMHGYMGKLLRVDLTNEKITEEHWDEATLRKYPGGTALGAKVLYEEVPPGAAWNDPRNRFIVAAGPLSGTRIGGSGTISVVTKGPMTNGATSTQANGFFGAYLRFSGYDGVIIEGAAKRWLYLYIHDNTAELRDASHLLGKDTWETDDLIKKELGLKERGMSVFGIGPAGENLVRFAALCGDKGHAAGHNGSGAVLGSKRLKAICVARGRARVPVKNGARVSEVSNQLREALKTNPDHLRTSNYGTLDGVYRSAKGGWLPIKNYTTNDASSVMTDEQLAKFTGPYIRENFQPKANPCWACQLHHCHMMRVPDGPFKGELIEEPEYEGLAALGPVTGQPSVSNAAYLATLVDKLGMDMNETGWVIGLTMECYERGLINREDTDGLEMTWGNAQATKTLLERIARREGFGNLLAEGARRAAAGISGAQELSVSTIKGSSPRGHDHRSLWFELFDTTVSSTGTIEAHRQSNRKFFDLPEKWNPFSPKDVVDSVSKTKGIMQFEDSLVTCRFNTQCNMPLLLEAVNAATGWDMTFDEAMAVGRRAVNLLKAFNLRHGLGPEADRPSPRYSSAPVDGVAKGVSIAPVWNDMLHQYYEQMGWDRETGRPLPETLKGLGLESVTQDIWGRR